MKKKKEIIPTILVKTKKDFIAKANLINGLVKKVQVDFCDGRFVKNKTLNLSKIIPLIRRYPKIKFELHIMSVEPYKIIKRYGKYFSKISFHIDNLSKNEIEKILLEIKKLKKRSGIAILHKSPLKILNNVPNRYFSSILLLCIEKPGFSGQKFARGSIQRIKLVKRRFNDKLVEVDGGVTIENIKMIGKYADIVDASSAIYNADNIKERVLLLKRLVK